MSLCGKSTIGKFIQSLYPRNIVIDTMNEYKTEPAITDLDSFLLFLKQNKNANFGKLIFRWPRGTSENSRMNTFQYLCEAVFLFGNVNFTVEECHRYCTPHTILSAYSDLLTGGRHNFVSLVNSSQRYSKVNGDIPSQSDSKFCGMLDEENDLKAACNLFVGCRNEIMNLRRYEFLNKNTLTKEIVSMNTGILRL